MSDLSAPARPPVPARLTTDKSAPLAAKIPINSKLPPWFPQWLRKKRYLYITLAIIFLWIILAIAIAVFKNIQKANLPKPEFHSVVPTATPTLPVTGSLNNLPDSVTITQTRPGWQRYTNSQGGWWFEYPTLFTLQTSTDLYASWQPTWYADTYYFDCINRQVGSRNPFPCWVFQFYLSTGEKTDTNILSELTPENGPPTTINDSQNRSWQALGPVTVGDTWRLYATRVENDVAYVFDTRTVKRNFSNFIQTHPQRPFAENITGVDDSSLQQGYQSLLQQFLGTFTVLRKPLIPPPTWLRHRFSANWSVAYPGNWEFSTGNESNLAAQDEGLLIGWYGNGDSVSRHRYVMRLTTPDMSALPPSANLSLQNWVDAEVANLSAADRSSLQIIGQGRRLGRRDRKTVEFDSTIITNFPDQLTPLLTLGEPLPHSLVHRAYIWEFDELPPRIVTIKQLDPGFEPEPMQKLLLTFVNRIYE